MSQPPYGRPQQPGHPPQPGFAPAPVAWPPPAPEANIVPGVLLVVWAGMALSGGIVATAYLVLGAAMTYRLEGVFGDDPFNWAVLLVALIGQLVGLIVSLVVMVFGIRAKRQRKVRGTTAMALGIVAFTTFVLIGLIQLPLVPLFFDALELVDS